MATLYFCALPSAASAPTWDRANIATNAGFSGSPAMHGTQTGVGASATDYEPTISWTGSLSAGTEYKLWAIWDDGASSSDAGVPQPSAAFTTLPLAELAATGATGTFAGVANSTTSATLAAAGETGSFSGTANSRTSVTLAATGGTGTFAGSAGGGTNVTLDATGGSGTFSGSASSPATVSLAATGGTGTFSGIAGNGSLAALAVTGESGVFGAVAFSTTTAAVGIVGGSGAFAGIATGVQPAIGSSAIFVRPRKKYVIEHRGRLIVFSTEAEAQEAQRRITAAREEANAAIAAASTSSKTRRVKARAADVAQQVLQSMTPADVVPLAEIRAMASAAPEFEQAMESAMKLRDMTTVYQVWQAMRDDEDDVAALLEFL